MDFQVVIPARYASVRLPGKPLCDIGGKPMLAHVYARACESGAKRVLIATDDERIREAAAGFGAEAWMTSPQHRSGTDRLAEAVKRLGTADDAIIVNLQGDEPLMPPALIRQAAQALADHPEAEAATLCKTIRDRKTVWDPHVVKVVRDARGFALYFSRAPIPWLRDSFSRKDGEVSNLHAGHIGLYAYRAAYLQVFTRLPVCKLEQDETLEQLRILFNGGKIFVAEACEAPGPGVDTAEDLARVRQLILNY
ncbi:MAG: 3-deoxy-manno-octulosonate cytidylyltransferase [Gammaproteobacteria bacterium]|nr:3-deoxy-manno-octulosonate cytidylyltransferase [Gammaproteobacteria bacterium]